MPGREVFGAVRFERYCFPYLGLSGSRVSDVGFGGEHKTLNPKPKTKLFLKGPCSHIVYTLAPKCL